jgi:ribosomal protein S27AE
MCQGKCNPTPGATCLDCGHFEPFGRGRPKKKCVLCGARNLRLSRDNQKCEQCDKGFFNGNHKDRRFCSPECAAASLKHPRKTRHCEICNKEFVLDPRREAGRKQRFCSHVCSYEHKKRTYPTNIKRLSIRISEACRKKGVETAKRNRDAKLKKMELERHKLQESIFAFPVGQIRKLSVCLVCGSVYKSRKLGKFCSEECSYEMHLLKVKQKIGMKFNECQECGVVFWANKDRKFCSSKCATRSNKRNRNHRLRTIHKAGESVSLRKLIESQNGYCCYCGTEIERSKGKYEPNMATIDHVVPVSLGGSHTYDNCRAMCVKCNSERSNNGIGIIDTELIDSIKREILISA